MQRLIKDLININRTFPIRGSDIIVNFKDRYALVDEKYIHHFQFYPGFEILPVGSTIPEEKPIDLKVKKGDNKISKPVYSDKKSNEI